MPLDLDQIGLMLGGLNPRGGGSFLRGYTRAQQEREQREAIAAQQRRQEEQLRIQQAQEARAQEVLEHQRQQQRLQGLNSIREMLQDPDLDDPLEFQSRLTFAKQFAPQLGIDPGFVDTLRPTPDALTRRTLAKRLKEFDRLNDTERSAFEQSGVWAIGGQTYTPAQARQLVSGMQASSGQPLAFTPQAPKPDVPNTTEEAHIADAIAIAEEQKGRPLTRGERAQVRLTAVEEYARIRGRADDRPRVDTGGQDPRKVATFNQIAGAYERSPLIRAADRTIVLGDAIKAIEANPSDPASQLSLAYSYIQALDTYQSAVREGELQNLGVLGTRLQQWATELNRVANEGAFLPPAVAKNIAASAKQLIQTIEAGRARKEQEFGSRAKVSGVGDMWDSFTGGFGGRRTSGPRPGGTTNPFRQEPVDAGRR